MEEFVSCNGLRPPGVSMICPSSEDFVSYNGLWPQRASMICPSSEDFILYQWRTSTTMGHGIQTGASQRKQQCRRGIKRMYYLDEGGRFCVGHLVDARMITALGWGQRLDPKKLWACFNDDTWWGLGRITHLDLIGNSAVTIRDYVTTVHKRKIVLELTQGGFPTNCPPRWLALYGYLQFSS
jgi:hypothetical protein